MKQEALSLLNSRTLGNNLAFHFLGWLEQAALTEAEGGKEETVGTVVARFVEHYGPAIRALPLRK